MRRWKRVLLGLCLLILAAVALLHWGGRDARSPLLSISFVGYTNQIAGNASSTKLLAVLCASNSGPVTLKVDDLHGFAWLTSERQRTGPLTYLPDVYSDPSHLILGPGETFSFEILPPAKFYSLGGQAFFHRWRDSERLYRPLSAIVTSSTLRRWLDKILPGIDIHTVQFGLITNQPPATVQLKRDE